MSQGAEARQLTDAERLYVAQAVFKRVSEAVSTKDAGSLRSRCDEEMRRVYDETGFRSADAKLFGEKVGTYSVRLSKPVPASTETRLVVEDPEAVLAWARDEATDERAEWERETAGEFAEWCLARYGEVPDGCRAEEAVHEAEPARVTGTTLKVDPERVAEVMRERMPGATVAGLLGGANG